MLVPAICGTLIAGLATNVATATASTAASKAQTQSVVAQRVVQAKLSPGDKQVDTWRAKDACRGFKFLRSAPLRENPSYRNGKRISSKNRKVYGWLRVYVKRHKSGWHDWCAVNLASKRNIGHKLNRSVVLYAPMEFPSDSGRYRYYAGAVKLRGYTARAIFVGASVRIGSKLEHGRRVKRLASAIVDP